MDDEIEDLVGDIKFTDSQKSVATTIGYSLHFTDSSSDIKNNSSGKDTYVLECDDSEDSEIYSLRECQSILNLNGKCGSHLMSNRDLNLQHEVNNKRSTEVSTSIHKCSIVAQEIYTQTSKTIIELAETDGVFRKSDNNTLETQTSFLSITENKTVEYRIQVSDARQNYSGNEIVYESDKEHDTNEYSFTRKEILSNTLEDESSKFPVSETDNQKSDSGSTIQSSITILNTLDDESSKFPVSEIDNEKSDGVTSQSSLNDKIILNTLEDESSKFPVSKIDNEKSDSNTSQSSMNDKIILITDDDSKENIGEHNDISFENSSDYESSRYNSDVEEDSLMEQHRRKLENGGSSHSDTSEAKSVENDVAELYNILSEKIDLKLSDIPCEPGFRHFGTLTPLTEESTAVKKESLIDISPKMINLIEDSDSQTLFTNNAGMNVKVLPQDNKNLKDSFKLPPLQKNQSCPNSPHLNFLFSVNQSRSLSKAGTLPCLLEDQRCRWEIGTQDLASGESPLINGRNGLVWNTSGTVHLPPIHVEGYVLNSTTTHSNGAHSTKINTIKSEQRHNPISIKEKIKELKTCSKNTKSIPYRNNSETTHSRSVSPNSASLSEGKMCDAAERGCEALCAELLRRLRSNSWYEVTDTLVEIPKALDKFWGVIAEHRIADLIRQVSAHIESPRTVVTRTACCTLASILKNTNYTKKPDFYEAMTILLIKTGSYSRPVRRAANVALDDVVCSVELSHAVSALCIHGASHKSALVRCAAARLLVVCCALAGGGRELLRTRPPSAACARKHALQALAALLEDKSIDTRKYAERLYSMLRPLTNFEAYYLTDVDVELASRQMKKFDQMLCSQETR